MAGPVAALTHAPKGQQRKRLILLAVAALAFVWWRRQQGQAAAATGIVGSADPTAAGGGGGTLGGGSSGDTSGTAATGPDAATAAALEGLSSGLTDLSAKLANSDANQQSLADAFAQEQQQLNNLFSSPGSYDPYAGAAVYAPPTDTAPATGPYTTPASSQTKKTSPLPRVTLPKLTLPKFTLHPPTPVTLTPARVQQAVRAAVIPTYTAARVQAALPTIHPPAVNPSTGRATLKFLPAPGHRALF